MKRRDLFAVLSVMPLIGGLFSVPVVASVPTVAESWPDKMSRIRNRLLPVLRSYAESDIELDIQISFIHDCLVVKGYCSSRRKLLGFIIPREQIRSGGYRATFTHDVLDLIECLKDDYRPLGVCITLGQFQALSDRFNEHVADASRSWETHMTATPRAIRP